MGAEGTGRGEGEDTEEFRKRLCKKSASVQTELLAVKLE